MRLDWENLTVTVGQCGYSLWPKGVTCAKTWKGRILQENDLWILDTGKGTIEMIQGKCHTPAPSARPSR